MSLFVDAVLSSVDLVDGLGSGVVDLGCEGCLANAHTILVDQFDEEASLLVGYR